MTSKIIEAINFNIIKIYIDNEISKRCLENTEENRAKIRQEYYAKQKLIDEQYLNFQKAEAKKEQDLIAKKIDQNTLKQIIIPINCWKNQFKNTDNYDYTSIKNPRGGQDESYEDFSILTDKHNRKIVFETEIYSKEFPTISSNLFNLLTDVSMHHQTDIKTKTILEEKIKNSNAERIQFHLVYYDFVSPHGEGDWWEIESIDFPKTL